MNNSPQVFTAFVNDGYIYERDPYMREQPRIIGVVMNMFDNVSKDASDLRDTCTQYYNKLVELGEIKIPKTAEEISEANNKALEKILDRLEKLENKEMVKDECTDDI